MDENTVMERAIERAVSAEKDAAHALDGVKRINGQIIRMTEEVSRLREATNQGFELLRREMNTANSDSSNFSSRIKGALVVLAVLVSPLLSVLAYRLIPH